MLSGETPVAPKCVYGHEGTIFWGVGRLPMGASGGLHKGRSSEHLLHTFYVALVCGSRVGSVVHLTHFLSLYPNQVGLTVGENHIFWVLNRLSAIRKKEKQWALQPCLPALPLVVTLPLARLSAWPLLTCGAFNKEKEGSNFILSMRVIHVLKGDKNVIRKFSCQMCGKWNQFINAVKPMCEIGIKGAVSPLCLLWQNVFKTKGSCAWRGDAAVVTTRTSSKQTQQVFFSTDALQSVGMRDAKT